MDKKVVFGADVAAPQWGREFRINSDDEIRAFARGIEDFNPLHHDNATARAAGFQGIIAPGVMTMGYLSATIAHEIPGALIRRLEVDFSKPLYSMACPTVTCTLVSRRGPIAKVDFVIKNLLEPVAKGSCTLILPQKAA
jgi:acyl dehydratase